MKEASAEARNMAVDTTSSDSPGRSINTPSRMMARVTGFCTKASVPGVAMKPGLMLTARMPSLAPSTATWRVNDTTAPLAAACAEMPAAFEPAQAATDDTLMTTPPRTERCFHAYLVAKNTRSISLRIV
jgi:hypothetical protein